MRYLVLIVTVLASGFLSGCGPSVCDAGDAEWSNCEGKKDWRGDEYSGSWLDNKPHGQGVLTTSDGAKYVGEWEGGKAHGQGTYTETDGEKYVGGWRYNRFHGKGTFTKCDDCPSYDGEWKGGDMHGQGTLYAADGSIERTGWWCDDEESDKPCAD